MKYVGIIGRNNDNKITFNKELINIINKYNLKSLGIIVDFENNPNIEFNKIKNLIDMCDYFILQGGNDYYDIDIMIVKYLYNKNIPTLGICLGMQTMAMAFNGTMGNICNHNSNDKYVHDIIINTNSKLYEIIKKENIKVNSRHNSYIINTDLKVSAISNVIEAIEDKNKLFFIGVQWHPESIYDENNKLLFDFLFNCNKF
jgi:CTP synthase (UTP-ammonia lyase)